MLPRLLAGLTAQEVAQVSAERTINANAMTPLIACRRKPLFRRACFSARRANGFRMRAVSSCLHFSRWIAEHVSSGQLLVIVAMLGVRIGIGCLRDG